MNQKKLSDLTDQELLQEAKRVKSTSITNAFLVGFLLAIVLYSVFKNNWGFVALIPLYFTYKLINKSKYDNTELEALLKQRNLK